MNKLTLPFLILIISLLFSCEKEIDNSSLISGFWAQDAISVDGSAVSLTTCEEGTRLLIEQNGIYRLFSPCDTMERAGTWLISDNTMLDLSIDRWNGSNKYEPYPVRFTILKITDSELEIRIKTFIGDRKKLVLFTPLPQDDLSGLTEEELVVLDRYNKELRTYIYSFVKID